MSLKVLWSQQAIDDLKHIYDWFAEIAKSIDLAKRIRSKLIQKSKTLTYPQQYQVDEVLGNPYRHLIVGHYKIVYREIENRQIIILRIFDTRQNPERHIVEL